MEIDQNTFLIHMRKQKRKKQIEIKEKLNEKKMFNSKTTRIKIKIIK